MGKCISKHPSVLTLELPLEKDSSSDEKILNQFEGKITATNLQPNFGTKEGRNCVSNGFAGQMNGHKAKQQQTQKQHQQQQQQQQQENNSHPLPRQEVKEQSQSECGQAYYYDDDDDDEDDDDDCVPSGGDFSSESSRTHRPYVTSNDCHYNNNNQVKVPHLHRNGRHAAVALTEAASASEAHTATAADDDDDDDGHHLAAAAADNNNKMSDSNNNTKNNIHLNCISTADEATSDGATDVDADDDDAAAKKDNASDHLGILSTADPVRRHSYPSGPNVEHQGQAESKKLAKKHNTSGGGGDDCGDFAGNGGLAAGSIETKGTAMSFGFRKKFNTTPKKLKKFIEGHDSKKKQDKCNNIHDYGGGGGGGGGEVIAAIDVELNNATVSVNDDDNGNAAPKVHFKKVGAAAKSTGKGSVNSPVAMTANAEPDGAANRPGVGNRFGYRGIYYSRPSSTGTNAMASRYHSGGGGGGGRITDANDIMENNNNNNYRAGEPQLTQRPALVSNLKRRSKSAHTGRASHEKENNDDASTTDGNAAAPKITQPKTITFDLSQNSTIEYQRRQFFEQPPMCNPYKNSLSQWPQQQQHHHQYGRNIINTGIHTNLIVRPTPRTAQPAQDAVPGFTKFTLHTVSLPKPEFPVAISLGAGTPTTPGSVYTPSPTTLPGNSVHSAGGFLRGANLGINHNNANANNNNNNDINIQVVHPLTIAQSQNVDLKTAKHMANSSRRGFSGSREISADSGIASMDMALDISSSSGVSGSGSGSDNGAAAGSGGIGKYMARRSGSGGSPSRRSRSRPRNLQMVMNGRHKFEVRDLDDPLSSESGSFVEPLALPKLPSESQTTTLPLSGLVRSNTVLSLSAHERQNEAKQLEIANVKTSANPRSSDTMGQPTDGHEEEKVSLDRSTSEKSAKFREINTCSSKTSSPGSSMMSSWCNAAGESMAPRDCSNLSMSISSIEDSNKIQEKLDEEEKKALELNDDDLSLLNTDIQFSTISSITEIEPAAPSQTLKTSGGLAEALGSRKTVDLGTAKDEAGDGALKHNRPKSICNTLNESRFAEMALAGSAFLLDDETSPTDSLVSSTESEEEAAGSKQKKHKLNEDLLEKDIDEISPELEVGSPISPGTPTHASRSLSLSDCGNLIDDEIADQPALLFNDGIDGGGEMELPSVKEKTDTPTLMETGSMPSLKVKSRPRNALQQAIELSLLTPMSVRRAVMDRAESLDTLSPCESICSDDLMVDFDINSSIDSIDRSTSIKSRSGSDLNKIDDTELFSELERRGSDVMKELNTIMRMRSVKRERESVIAHLPARATRLLNRSRLQPQCPLASGSNADTPDSSRSPHSIRRSSRASSASTSHASQQQSQSQQQKHCSHPHSHHHHHHYNHHQQQQQQQQQQHHLHHRDSQSSSDDLMLYDKSFRNAMIQDVLQFKRQLLRLRRILQEDEDYLTRTETLNPFENDNGQLFASCGLDSKLLDDIDLASLTASITDDPIQELADLRRQVVYLQSQVDDRDRTIRLQRDLIEKLEAEKTSVTRPVTSAAGGSVVAAKECMNIATQTERLRPLSIGPEGLSRSKPEYTSYTTHFPFQCNSTIRNSSTETTTPATTTATATTIVQQQDQQNSQSYLSNKLSYIGNSNGNGHGNGHGDGRTRRHTIISATLTNYDHHQVSPSPFTSSIAPVASSSPDQRRASLAATAAPSLPVTPTYKPVRITLIGDPLKQWAAITNNSSMNGHSNGQLCDMVNGGDRRESADDANGRLNGVTEDQPKSSQYLANSTKHINGKPQSTVTIV